MRVCEICKKDVKDSSVLININGFGNIRTLMNNALGLNKADLELDFCEIHGLKLVSLIEQFMKEEK